MTLLTHIEAIKVGLQQPLPGWNAQKRMSPETRLGINRAELVQPDHREGAVLILLYPGVDKQPNIVFIRRPEYNGVHSGQIALPGGTREPNEPLQTTALREAYEEVGVSAQNITILGALSSIYIPPSNFMVYPYVGFQRERPQFNADRQEVAEIIEAPLMLLLNPATKQNKVLYTETFGDMDVPFFDVRGHHIWGATAIILSEFLEILKPQLSKNDHNTGYRNIMR